MMLNYLEQAPLYNAANFSWGPFPTGALTPINYTTAQTVIKAFLCPSDPNSGSGQNGDVSYGGNINNYAASFGTDTTGGNYAWDCNNAATNHQDPMGCVGMFGWAVSYGVQHCTDGTSNTIAYAEWLVGDGKAHQRQPLPGEYGDDRRDCQHLGIYNALTNLPNIQTALQTCRTKFAPRAGQQCREHQRLQGLALGARSHQLRVVQHGSTAERHGRRLLRGLRWK